MVWSMAETEPRSGSVHVEERDRVATIRFDNQEKRNALGPPILAKITREMEQLEERDDIRTVVLTGTGDKAFSAGFDITYHQRNYGEGPDVEEEEGDFADLAELVKNFDFPVIAMINGGTYGGAMYLIAACDLRIAVDDAQFGITPAKLGMVYGDEAIYEVMTHIGPANAKEFLYTGEFVDAQRAYDMGLLNRVVPREELEETTYEMAETIAGNAPMSLTGMKKIIRALVDQGALTPTEHKWAQELREEAKASKDHEEGVKAFMENRDPEFEGK